MAQISKGHTYTSTGAGSLVTYINLNEHVDNALLLSGAITEQTSNPVTANTDLLLINKGGVLYKQTKLQFTDNIDSNTVSVNTLSAEDATVDYLSLFNGTIPAGTENPAFNIGKCAIVSSDANVRIGYGIAITPTGGTPWTSNISFASTAAHFFGFSSSGVSQPAYVNVNGDLNIIKQSYGGVTDGGDLLVQGDASVIGNITANNVTVSTDLIVGGFSIAKPRYYPMSVASNNNIGASAAWQSYDMYVGTVPVGDKQIEITIPNMTFGYVNGDNDGLLSLKVEIIAKNTVESTEHVIASWYASSNGRPWGYATGTSATLLIPKQEVLTPSDVDLTARLIKVRATAKGAFSGDYIVVNAMSGYLKFATVIKTETPITTPFAERSQTNSVNDNHGGGENLVAISNYILGT